MGKHFGDLGVKIRGIVYYKLASREQKAFAGAAQGVMNFVPRTFSSILMWLPQFLWGYGVYRYCEYLNWQSKRKNPADYAHETDPEADDKKDPKKCKVQFEMPPRCKTTEVEVGDCD